MSPSTLLIDKNGAVATVTLNRPQAMNAISTQMGRELGDVFEALEADGSTRVIILTGAGRAFCAGVDLKELGGEHSPLHGAAGLMGDPSINGIARMAAFSGPVIAAVNGPAITGGFELALGSDLIICSTQARFADTHARVGVYPGGGISQMLSRALGLYRAMELSLTGNFLTAEQAYGWGLVNRVVAPEELLLVCHALAQDMLTLAPDILRGYKKLIRDGFGMNYRDGLALENATATEAGNRVQACDVEQQRQHILRRGREQQG